MRGSESKHGSKPRLVLWSLLLIVPIVFIVSRVALFDDPLNADMAKETLVVKPSINSSLALPGASVTPIKQKNLSIRSTPREHDQLAVSPSLEGTSIDGSLKAGIDGSLVLDIEVRDFFDYFLSIADDVGPEQAIGEIQRYAQRYLPEPASSQAIELLGNYLRYKQTEFTLQQTPINQASLGDNDALQLLRESFGQLKSKRQSLFSTEQDNALFGLEDSYANYTLSSLELMANETTSDKQKRQQLEALESKLPPALSASFRQTEANRQRQLDVDVALNSANGDTQVYEQLNQQGLDQQQSDAIIQRRQQQRQFDSTYQRYQKEKQRLDRSSAGYNSTITALQNRYFTSPEEQTQAKLRDLNRD